MNLSTKRTIVARARRNKKEDLVLDWICFARQHYSFIQSEMNASTNGTASATFIVRRIAVRRLRSAFAIASVVSVFAMMYGTAKGGTMGGGVTENAKRARAFAVASLCGFIGTTWYLRNVDRALGVRGGPNASASGHSSEGVFGRASAYGGSGSATASQRGRAWNGSAWVEDTRDGRPPGNEWMHGGKNGGGGGGIAGEDAMSGTGSFGYGGYQDEVRYEDARARAEAERAEQEKWARWEAEDEEREAKRAERRAEKKAEDKAKKEKSRAKRWVKYDERWAALDASSSSSSPDPLSYDDVPWPPKMKELLEREAGGPDASDRDRKLAYHRCVKRWHPDKFLAKFRDRIRAGGDHDRVVERVEAVAKAITIAYSASAA